MLTPTGPHPVGCRDWSWRRPGGGPLSGANNAVGRLFYPAAPGSRPARRATQPVADSWIRNMAYARGYVLYAFFSARSFKWRVMSRVLQGIIYATGAMTKMPVAFDAPLAAVPDGGAPYPIVIFSPGAAANANTYSAICVELASRGCVVVSMEHADGSSGAARLADGGWRMFAGLGSGPTLEAKCEHRVEEVMSAVAVMRRLNKGGAPDGLLQITGPADLAGSMDFGRLTVTGHSCGGGAAVLAASRHPEVAAAVALDPWWPILPTDSPALTQWLPGCRAPLLVIGSDEWNTPQGVDGSLRCDGPRQLRVFEAARRRDGGGGGGGALFLVPRDSKHHTFADVPALIEGSALGRGVTRLMGIRPSVLGAAAATRLIVECMSRFSRAHSGGGSGGEHSTWPTCSGGGGGGGGGDCANGGGVSFGAAPPAGARASRVATRAAAAAAGDAAPAHVPVTSDEVKQYSDFGRALRLIEAYE